MNNILKDTYTYRTTYKFNFEKNRVEEVRVVYCSISDGEKEWFGKAKLTEGNGSKRTARNIALAKAARRMNKPYDTYNEIGTFQEYADECIEDLEHLYRQRQFNQMMKLKNTFNAYFSVNISKL